MSCGWTISTLRKEIYFKQKTELSEIIIFFFFSFLEVIWKILLHQPHLKYSFFPQYLFIQFCSVLFLNVLFISLKRRCGSRRKKWKKRLPSVHPWRSSSLVFLSIQQFIYFHNKIIRFFALHFFFMGPVRCSIVNFFLVPLTLETISVSTILHHTMLNVRARRFVVVQLT